MSDSKATKDFVKNSSDASLIRSEVDYEIDESIIDAKSPLSSTPSILATTTITSQPPNGYPKGFIPLSTPPTATLLETLLPTTPPSLTPSLSLSSHQPQSPLQSQSTSSFLVSNSSDHHPYYHHLNHTQYSPNPQELSHHHSNKFFRKLFSSSTPKRHRQRIVLKNGGINLCKEHIEKRSQRYLQDTFTTMVDLRWRYNLLVFTLGFVLSWLLFASIWYIVAYFHDDLGDDVPHERCVIGVNSFITAFLFSFESQHTIGFGNRYPHENCVEGIFFMCFQSIFGVMIECFVVGFVFAKLSRPKKRSQTLIFSRHAVVNVRDGSLCLVFRVGDVRARSYIIGASVSALLISKKISPEGEILPYYHESLKVSFDSCGTSVFLVWPATIYHVIDETSPFYSMGPEALANGHFEIVAMLRGTVESTGQTIEARTSYLPEEIDWGRRFERLIDFRMQSGIYRVDYSKFDSTYEISTPRLSAEELSQQNRHQQQQQRRQEQPYCTQANQVLNQHQRLRRPVSWNPIEDHNKNKFADSNDS
ncbi:G protein-activated inward rectifier potassium channel 3-like [Tetranychus urticae]|uniref:G protein-activated inward rectifier potassium channel 3-like n=1 Tax=Tetranychus urticae TaxID=32264 RepID=UPI00077BFE27|nr:G protein-activated inward rectifier potassium channel 3-like [Tetranychus urticae]